MASRGLPAKKSGKAKKRRQRAAANYNWHEPAPVECPYPWKVDLYAPWVPDLVS